MTSIKIVQFLRPLIPLVHLRPKFFHPLDLACPISNELPQPSNFKRRPHNLLFRDYKLLCVQLSKNISKIFLFIIIHIFSTHFAINLFICTTWKRKQTMEKQPHCVCERRRSKQKRNQVTSHSNWLRVLLFNLAHKQSNGIIRGWLHCLTPESKGRFLLKWCCSVVQCSVVVLAVI